MSLARSEVKGAPWAELRQRWSRERALIALFDHGLASSFARAIARSSAFVVFLGYASAIALSH